MNTEISLETIVLDHLISYQDAFELQMKRRDLIERGEAPNTLFLLEHKPVITLGKDHHKENILKADKDLSPMGIDICEANRGGDVTYHGPGQLIAYPILDLRQWHQSIRWYLRTLEEVIIHMLAEYGLKGERNEGLTGVWINDAKVAAIGIGIHNWVTFHGISINIMPEMSHFETIVPCGIKGRKVASLDQLLNEVPPMNKVMTHFERIFRNVFSLNL